MNDDDKEEVKSKLKNDFTKFKHRAVEVATLLVLGSNTAANAVTDSRPDEDSTTKIEVKAPIPQTTDAAQFYAQSNTASTAEQNNTSNDEDTVGMYKWLYEKEKKLLTMKDGTEKNDLNADINEILYYMTPEQFNEYQIYKTNCQQQERNERMSRLLNKAKANKKQRDEFHQARLDIVIGREPQKEPTQKVQSQRYGNSSLLAHNRIGHRSK